MLKLIKVLAAGSVLYLLFGYGSAYLVHLLQRQLEVMNCQQAAHADHRDDAECRALKLKPIALVEPFEVKEVQR